MKTCSWGPLVLAVLLSVQLGVATCGSDIPMPCCPYFSHDGIPWQWVYGYKCTESSCANEGVVCFRSSCTSHTLEQGTGFTTKTGKQFCVQPEVKWVQRYISLLNIRKQS